MINKLVKIANGLDRKGYYELADELDKIITKISAESVDQDRKNKMIILNEINKRLDEPGNSPERIQELYKHKKIIEERLGELDKQVGEPAQAVNSGKTSISYYLTDGDWRIVPQTGYANTLEDAMRMYDYHDGMYSLVERSESSTERRERIIEPSKS